MEELSYYQLLGVCLNYLNNHSASKEVIKAANDD